jgi:hypothetical protein
MLRQKSYLWIMLAHCWAIHTIKLIFLYKIFSIWFGVPKHLDESTQRCRGYVQLYLLNCSCKIWHELHPSLIN